MIDFDLEIKNIQPINIKNMELKRYKINDNIIKSIILYNKAVSEIKTKDLDLAINDLKKALSYNQGFAEGMKLLGLCYVNNKEYKKAEKTFKKLVKYEIYSELAKEYIKKLLGERNTGKFIIGFSVITIVITGFIIIYWGPSMLQTFSAKTESTNKLVNSEEKTDKNLDENKEFTAITYKEYENIYKKLDATKFELENYKNKYDILLMLNEIEKSCKDENYEKAGNALLKIKNMKFDDETKIKFDELWLYIKTNGIWPIYNQGNRLYKEGKYQEALPNLKIVSEIDPNLELMPWITYQIGTCYKETNDNVNALVFFQKVKDNYPNSTYAPSSETMINQIESKKINAIE